MTLVYDKSENDVMRAYKIVWQKYQPSSDVLDLLEQYRRMVNEAIRVGFERNISSRFRLCYAVYKELHNGFHTWYILSAIEKASTILRNYRKAKRKNPETKKPYAKKLFLSMGNLGYKIVDGKLRLAIKPRQYFYIPLNNHTLSILSEPNLKLGSVSLTTNMLGISFSKEIAEVEPIGYIGVDRNLENVTTASTDEEISVHDLSRVTQITENCREATSDFKRNDNRIRQRIYAKYGRIRKNRIDWLLHNVSSKIVKQAKQKQFGIVMEDLKGIRRLYKRGNGQGKNYRGRLNSWSFYELQCQIEYKASWEGIPVFYVPACRTSSVCAICGSQVIECAERKVFCPKCEKLVDRDQNAALNIVKAGLRFSLKGEVNEAVKRDGGSLILRADAPQLTQHS
jgi:putative transposase